jgi:hypothetical protein
MEVSVLERTELQDIFTTLDKRIGEIVGIVIPSERITIASNLIVRYTQEIEEQLINGMDEQTINSRGISLSI